MLEVVCLQLSDDIRIQLRVRCQIYIGLTVKVGGSHDAIVSARCYCGSKYRRLKAQKFAEVAVNARVLAW